MRVRKYFAALVLFSLVTFAPIVRADLYSTFQTTRYYSSNRRYLVIVTEQKRAALYRNGRRVSRIWSQALSELPSRVFVTNDGKRVVMFERYYGNNNNPSMPVITIYNDRGVQIARNLLGEVANLERVMTTISSAHWYREIRLSPDERFLQIETEVARVENWAECFMNTPVEEQIERDRCLETIPYLQLRFALENGELVERISVASR